MKASLVYVTDSEPGITRAKCGRGFSYKAPDGTTVARGPERERIEALAIPPAYDDVWICVKPNGHLQATGRDARRRKQYRYHPEWTKAQASTKFSQLAEFGYSLPKIRRRIDRDLKADPGDLEFSLAAAVTIIDRASLRVGHPDYVKENGSYGTLTLRRRHLTMGDDNIQLNFTAKGGRKVRQTVTDRKLQRLLHKVNDLPGATLLTWIDDTGEVQKLSSNQLNAYLAEAAGSDAVTAKTFRTWAGTLAAFSCAQSGSTTIKDMAEAAAVRLQNTPTVARTSYIHPDVIELANGAPVDVKPIALDGLLSAEQRLLGFLDSV